MEIVTNGKFRIKEPTAVAIGNFDGLHVGHQLLINKITDISKERSMKSVACTFNNHTATIIKERKLPNVLMGQEQRSEAFRKMKVDFLYLLNFDESVMHLAPKDFVKKILIEELNAKLVVVGFNFRFGYKAKGDVNYLNELGNELGFDVLIIPPVCRSNKIVSSTYIREIIKKGNIREANILLGKSYSFRGKVISGKRRGKDMGFPTANLKLSENYIIPKCGVYKTITNYQGEDYLSVTNIGNNPTFNCNNISIETYLLNFDKDIYGETIEIKFIDFIRNEKKFSSKNELIKQMKSDIETIKLEK